MATARPFAYNPGPQIPGTEQVGNLSIGTPTSGFTSTPQYWNGPDEELGYVIAQSVSGNTQPTPLSGVTASVGFFRSDSLTDGSFITLSETIAGQSFSSATEASVWLTTNGFWNSYVTSLCDTFTFVGNNAITTSNSAINDGTPGWDSSAYSLETFTGPVSVTFQTSANGNILMGGFSYNPTATPGSTYEDTSYGIYLTNSDNVEIYENGAQVTVLNVGTVVSSSDVWKVDYDGTSVKYYYNSTLLYTSTNPVTQPLHVFFPLFTPNEGAVDICVIGTLSPTPTTTPTNSTTPTQTPTNTITPSVTETPTETPTVTPTQTPTPTTTLTETPTNTPSSTPSPTPNIVTSGLIIQLDAYESSSYPGTGTTVFDITSGFNHTLIGATYTVRNGIKCFDCTTGTNRVAVNGTGPTLPTSGYTYITWARLITSTAGFRTLLYTNSPKYTPITIPNGTNTLGYWDTSFKSSGYDVASSADVWVQYAVVGTNTSQTFYINGSQVGSTISAGAGGTTHWGWGNNDTAGQPWGHVANMYFYNRQLSLAEITQQYNYLGPRFVEPTPTPTTTSTPTVTPTNTPTNTTTNTPTVTPTSTQLYFLLFEDSSIATAENNDNIEIDII